MKTLDEILEVLQWDTSNSELHYLMKSYRTHKISEDYANKELSLFNSRQEAKQEILDFIKKKFVAKRDVEQVVMGFIEFYNKQKGFRPVMEEVAMQYLKSLK